MFLFPYIVDIKLPFVPMLKTKPEALNKTSSKLAY
jgi:hypothetical protein